MMRAVIIAVLSFAGIIAGDVVFRTSLLHQIRPVILSPSDQAVIDPPVHLIWDGPQQMRVSLSIAGEAARTARDKALGRTKFLSEENAALRDESERLAKQLEALYKSQDDETERTAELERRLAQLSEENRALTDENAAIRQRLSTVVPCTVWGYFSFPQPQMIPLTRRALNVSDGRGQVFRTQPECELIRRADPTAASICFCVGNSWGG
jgi:regulator of replication initiation timing